MQESAGTNGWVKEEFRLRPSFSLIDGVTSHGNTLKRELQLARLAFRVVTGNLCAHMSSPTPDDIKNALKAVKYPGYSRDIVSFGLIKEANAANGAVSSTTSAASRARS